MRWPSVDVNKEVSMYTVRYYHVVRYPDGTSQERELGAERYACPEKAKNKAGITYLRARVYNANNELLFENKGI